MDAGTPPGSDAWWLAAHYAVTRVLAEGTGLEQSAPRILRAIGESLGWSVGSMWVADPGRGEVRCIDAWQADGLASGLVELSRGRSRGPGSGLPGTVWQSGEAWWTTDLERAAGDDRARAARAAGLEVVFGFPIRSGSGLLGVLEFFGPLRKPENALLPMMAIFGSQIGQFMERIRAEEDTRRMKFLLTEAEQMAGLGCFEVDLQTGAVTWSDQLYRLLGYEPDEILPSYAVFLETIHPDDRRRVAGVIGEALQQGVPYSYEARAVRRDGSVITFRSDGKLVFDASGAPVRLLGTGLDITERRRAEERLREHP